MPLSFLSAAVATANPVLMSLSKKVNIRSPVICSPLAYISPHAQVADGTIVMHHALMPLNTRLSRPKK